jgi:CheY-like chemotaxis protein
MARTSRETRPFAQPTYSKNARIQQGDDGLAKGASCARSTAGEDAVSQLQQVDILLVEDTESDAELTLYALKKANLASSVTWVKDGQEALDFIYCEGPYKQREKASPRLILLDLKMPKIDGLQVTRRLKSDPATQSIPIVILTSSCEDRDVAEGYRIGANSYLVKPVEVDKFIDIIQHAGVYWTTMNVVR